MFMTCLAMVYADVRSDQLVISSPLAIWTHPISHLVVLIFDNENHVETRQDGSLEIDVLSEIMRISYPNTITRSGR